MKATIDGNVYSSDMLERNKCGELPILDVFDGLIEYLLLTAEHEPTRVSAYNEMIDLVGTARKMYADYHPDKEEEEED